MITQDTAERGLGLREIDKANMQKQNKRKQTNERVLQWLLWKVK